MQDSDKILTRLIGILKKLTNQEKPKIQDLAEQFEVTQRTIQRDLYQRLHYFPIEKNNNGELQFINGFSIEQSFLDDDEMLFTYLTLSKVKDENPHFREKIQKILKKLLKPQDKSLNLENSSFSQNDTQNIFIEIIQEGIIQNNILIIEFEENSMEVKPHRLIDNKTNPILLAHDISDNKIKIIQISTVKDIQKQKRKFRTKKSLEETLSNVHSAFFNDHNSKEFEVSVHKDMTEHFKNNKILPSQKVLSYNENGSMLMQFTVENETEAEHIIKDWMPYLRVTKPESYNQIFISKIQEYINIYSD